MRCFLFPGKTHMCMVRHQRGRPAPRMRTATYIVVLISVLVVLTACSTAPRAGTITPHADTLLTATPTVFFYRQPQRSGLEALLEGELVLVDGCLRVRAPAFGTSFSVVWPPEYSWHSEQGTVIIHDHAAQVVARVGDTVRFGGGAFGETPESLMGLDTVPAECPRPYWHVSAVVR